MERVNTTNMNMTNTNTNNTYNEEDMDLEMETPTTPTELRGTTATAEDDGTEGGGSRLKDDWKAWEARVKLERSVSGELHPAVCAGAGAESGAETEEVAVVPRTVVARTTTRGGVPIPPRRHPGRVASSMNMI